MDLPITTADLALIIDSLPAGTELQEKLILIKKVQDEHPHGPWKSILREQYNMVV